MTEGEFDEFQRFRKKDKEKQDYIFRLETRIDYLLVDLSAAFDTDEKGNIKILDEQKARQTIKHGRTFWERVK